MHATIKFHCQFCGAKISAKESLVGQSRPCPSCLSRITVPVEPLPAAMPPVKAAPSGAVAPTQSSLPQKQGLGMAMEPPQAATNTVPIEMRMPGNLGGLKAQVDQPTGNIIAATFAGGVLVAIGAFLIAMLGGKVRTA